MKFIFAFLSMLNLSVSSAQALDSMSLAEAQALLSQPSLEIKKSLDQAPPTYDFQNGSGQSSVHYPGQTLRQVLTADFKLVAGKFKRGQFSGNGQAAKNEINRLFRHSKTFQSLPFLTKAINESKQPMIIFEGIDYGSVDPSGKDLVSKMAGVDNDLRKNTLLGWSAKAIEGVDLQLTSEGHVLPSALVDQIIEAISVNAGRGKKFQVPNGSLAPQEISAAHITSSGVDLAQLGQKMISVSVSFSQAVGDYLSVDLGAGKGLNADNNSEDPVKGYTSLQHHWDEAFGYFGAARNFSDYTDTQIREGKTLDAYSSKRVKDGNDFLYIDHVYGEGDLQASLGSEKNFGFAINAGKRDVGQTTGNEDFTAIIFDSFRLGRHLLQEKPKDYLQHAQAYGVVAGHQWERLIAANTIHYINELIVDLESYGTPDFEFAAMAKHFGEMKGFALGFQFNPNSVMSEDQFKDLHQWLQDEPVNPTGDTTVYRAQLEMARDLLEKVYQFDHDDVVGW